MSRSPAPNSLQERQRPPPGLRPRPPGFRAKQVRPHLHPVGPHLDILTERACGRPMSVQRARWSAPAVPPSAGHPLTAGRAAGLLRALGTTRGSFAAHHCSRGLPVWAGGSFPRLLACVHATLRGWGGAWGTWRRTRRLRLHPGPTGPSRRAGSCVAAPAVGGPSGRGHFVSPVRLVCFGSRGALRGHPSVVSPFHGWEN